MRLHKKIFLGLSFLCATFALESTITWQTGTPVSAGTAVTATTSVIMGRSSDIFGTPPPPFPRLVAPKMPSTGPVEASFPAGQIPTGNSTLPSDATPNFTAITLEDVETYPPDATGAVGPTQYLLLSSGWIRSFNKITGLQDNILNTSTIAFFGSVLPPGAGVNNTRLRYDRVSNTWITTAVAHTSTTSQVMLAFSNGSVISPQTIWSFYIFKPSSIAPARSNPNAFIDFDTLGVDSHALYLAFNVY